MAGRVLQTLAPGQTRTLSAFESKLIYVLAAATCGVFVAVAFGVYIDRALLLYWFLVSFLQTAPRKYWNPAEMESGWEPRALAS